jgi:hypothetical protein
MCKKFRKYTIVIWVQPKYAMTFPCILVYVLFEPKSQWYIYEISLPLSKRAKGGYLGKNNDRMLVI